MAETVGVLTAEAIAQMREKFYADERNIQAQNVVTKTDPFEACISRRKMQESHYVFEKKIDLEGKPITNQKNSGRCWIFACLNIMRIPFMKRWHLEEFEFSQTYLYFWDKIERSNYFLHNIVKTARKGEEVDGRLVSFLLNDPTCDGGQWDMLVNLINRYGLVPKTCFAEAWTSESSSRMNAILKSKLREFAKELRDEIKKDSSEQVIEEKIAEQLNVVFRIVGICLGIPSEKITWEYYDKSKSYRSVGPISGLEFYKQYVQQCYNVDEKICLVSDPRPSNPYGKLYELDYLGNVVGGRKVLYNNQSPEILIQICAESIKKNEAVWFGCEVSKRIASKAGLQDLEIHDFKTLFNTEVFIGLSKADRLIYGDSMMTHAMVFTGFSTNNQGEITKFRVENSWGDDRGEKGYYVMTADWFKEFVFEIVVDKKLASPEVMAVFKQDPILLPAWDPMGTLAQ
ncbi:bleomycin hydrolase [Venturia canescens]|uniref:bleomycin hydrolase n=1 Tax=Venturia canescens TaxID=32260 RepID=UPI001C9BF660|nr:bleomycin hydrolase [Venturia canescens]